MCLSNVDAKPRRKQGVGYKCVKKREDGTYECYDYTPHAGSVRYPLNRWITDPRDGKASGVLDKDAGYRTGIHMSLNLRIVRRIIRIWCSTPQVVAIKLRFRDVTATGHDSTYGNQVVAREVCNLGEV